MISIFKLSIFLVSSTPMLTYLADGVLIHLHKTSSLLRQALTNSTSFMNVLQYCLTCHFSYLHPMPNCYSVFIFTDLPPSPTWIHALQHDTKQLQAKAYAPGSLQNLHSHVRSYLIFCAATACHYLLFHTSVTILFSYHIQFHMLQSRIISPPCIYFTSCTTSQPTFPRISGSPSPFVG